MNGYTNMRPICTTCNSNTPVAVNCHKNEKIYYRKQCDNCIRAGKKIKPQPPLWYKSGYRKKDMCDVCGYKAELPDKQLLVAHINGNLRDVDRVNLKTVCLNCHQLLQKKRLPWKIDKPTPGF